MAAADPNAPPESIIFGQFTGLKNTVSVERLAPTELEIALNVDLDDVGQLRRRRGFVKKLSGSFHSLFTADAGTIYGVKDGALGIIRPDYSFVQLMAGVGTDPTRQLAYLELNGTIYFTGPVAGKIQNGLVLPWGSDKDIWLSPVVNPTATLPAVSARLLGKPPLASYLTYFNGRIYLAQDGMLWATELYLYDFVDKTQNFYQFEDPITGLAALTTGMYVGTTSGVYWLSGTLKEMKRVRVMDSPMLPGSLVYIPAELANPPQVGLEADTPVNTAILFMTGNGYCGGQDGGTCYNFTENKMVFPDAKRVSAFYRRQDGANHYVAVANHGGTPTASTRIGDYVDAEIVRNHAIWVEVNDGFVLHEDTAPVLTLINGPQIYTVVVAEDARAGSTADAPMWGVAGTSETAPVTDTPAADGSALGITVTETAAPLDQVDSTAISGIDVAETIPVTEASLSDGSFGGTTTLTAATGESAGTLDTITTTMIMGPAVSDSALVTGSSTGGALMIGATSDSAPVTETTASSNGGIIASATETTGPLDSASTLSISIPGRTETATVTTSATTQAALIGARTEAAIVSDSVSGGGSSFDVLPAQFQAIMPSYTQAPTPTIYVDTVNGSDSNSGLTSAAPKKTFPAAVTLAASQGAGACIGVAKGSTVVGPIYIDAVSGVAGNPIWVTAYGSGAAPEFTWTSDTTANPYGDSSTIFFRDGSSHWTFDGGVKNGLVFHGAHEAAVTASGADSGRPAGGYFSFYNCEFYDLGICLELDDPTGHSTVQRCIFHDGHMVINDPTPDSVPGHGDYGANGIRISAGSGHLISFNYAYNLKAASYDYGIDGGFLEVYVETSNALGSAEVSYNYIKDTMGFAEGGGSGEQTNGVYLSQVNNLDIHHNIIQNCEKFFTYHASGAFGASYSGCRFRYNTFIQTAAHMSGGNYAYGASYDGEIASTSIWDMHHNLFYVNQTGSTQDFLAVYDQGMDTVASAPGATSSRNWHHDNAYYIPASGSYTITGGQEGMFIWTNWQDGLGPGEFRRLMTAPLFTNLSGGDFSIVAGSDATGYGAI